MGYSVQLSDIEKKIESKIDRAIDLSLDDKLARDLVEQIVKRTKLGYGVGENGEQTRLARLSDSYAERRRRLKGELDTDTSPKRSNLTATGQLLDALVGKIRNGDIVISIEGNRNGELGGYPSKYTNEEIADFVERQGRKFLGLTNSEKNALIRELRKRVERHLNNN